MESFFSLFWIGVLELIIFFKCLVQVFKLMLKYRNNNFLALSAARFFLQTFYYQFAIIKGCLHSPSASWRSKIFWYFIFLAHIFLHPFYVLCVFWIECDLCVCMCVWMFIVQDFGVFPYGEILN